MKKEENEAYIIKDNLLGSYITFDKSRVAQCMNNGEQCSVYIIKNVEKVNKCDIKLS